MSMIYDLMEKPLKIREMNNLSYAVFVSNEAIYAKATEIRPKEPEMFSSLFLIMGIFYILSMFLGITETQFRDAEFKYILIQSKINAGGYIKGVLSGKQYNPLVRSYKLLWEALWYLILDKCESECGKHNIFKTFILNGD